MFYINLFPELKARIVRSQQCVDPDFGCGVYIQGNRLVPGSSLIEDQMLCDSIVSEYTDLLANRTSAINSALIRPTVYEDDLPDYCEEDYQRMCFEESYLEWYVLEVCDA